VNWRRGSKRNGASDALPCADGVALCGVLFVEVEATMYIDAQGKFDEKAFEFTVCLSTAKAKSVGKCKFDLASYASLAATTELKVVEFVLKDGALAGAILHVSIGARVQHCVCKSPKHQQPGTLADGA
jgi:hypothetical protein